MNIRKSAAIIIVNAKQGKLLMGRRCSRSSFLPNAFVFPGGMVDDTDKAMPLSVTNLSLNDNISRINSNDENANVPDDYEQRIAAIRELFEECALLPIVDSNYQSRLLTANVDSRLREWHLGMLHGYGSLDEMMKYDFKNFRLDLNSLQKFSNWLTPFDYGKRFDTYFYTLDVSDNSDKEAIKIDSKSKELYEIDWYSAEEIVNRANSGQLILPPPQAYEIRRIIENRFGNLEQLYCPLKLCPQLLDAGDKVIALLNNDFAYNHDQNSTETPMRKACSADLPSAIGTSTVNEGKTRRQLHRMIFNKKPLWSQMKVIYCSTQQSQQQR